LRLAIFGGTFDPVHRAHLAVAREASARFALDRVLFVPAARPPHKAGITHASYDDRVRMVDLACAGERVFEVSRLEEGTMRSYSIDTIEKARRLFPGDELFFIIGADAFAEIGTWRRWQDVLEAVSFVVVSRPGHDYAIPTGSKVLRLDTLELPVSSSEIRRQLAAGGAPEAVPGAVMEYIRTHGLYGTEAHR
jgi:nicotinate-nucleotide adenylyltransferase